MTGTLTGSGSLSGQLELTIDGTSQRAEAFAPISLGITNLQQLQLFSDGQPVNFAYDEAGDLIPLSRPGSQKISGTWSKLGTRVGTSTIFQLEFPPAAVCDFVLKTDASILVTSPNAFVHSEHSAADFVSWRIRPNSSSRFTISCAERTTTQTPESLIVSMEANIRIEPTQTLLTWSVTVPASFSSQEFAFQFSELCAVTDVDFPDPNDGTWTSNTAKRTVSIKLRDSVETKVLRIKAVSKSANIQEFNLPFLLPLTWKSTQSQTRASVSTRSIPVQVSISPALLLTHVDLDGVYEGDVAYATDGTQTLDLVQFTTTPRATMFLTRSQPVIHDATVLLLDPKTQPGKALAYVSVEAKTGNLGEVEWNIPATWRVTEVKEVSTGLPLLFRVESSDTAPDSTTLYTYLRTPVAVAAGQALQVTLQATTTEVSSYTEPPTLSSAAYHRQFDFLATHDRGTRIGQPSAITAAALLELAPWLPADVLGNAQIYIRSSGGVKAEEMEAAGEEVFATIDYAVTRHSDIVRENVRLRLRRRGGIPARVPISVTPGIDVAISGESLSQQQPLLTRTSGNSSNWLLQLPASADLREELNVLLVANRRIQPEMPAMVVTVPGAQQSGGSIQPPSAQEGLSVLMADSEPALRKTISYPALPPQNMKLIQLNRDRSAQRISGTVFRILSRNNSEEIEIETAIRLQVDSTDADSFLKLRLADASHLSAFVNGRRSFAEVIDEILTVPLDRKSVTNVVDLHFRSSKTSKLSAPIVLPTVICPESDSQHIVSFTLLPPQTGIVEISADEQTLLRKPEHTDVLLTSVFGEQNQSTVAPHMVAFASRWNTCASQSETVLSSAPAVSRSQIRITMRDTRFDFAVAILCGIGFAFLWRLASMKLWVPGFCLLNAAVIAIVLPESVSPWLNGFMGGTGCHVIICILSRFPVGQRKRQLSSGMIQIATTAIMCCTLAGTTNHVTADEAFNATAINNEMQVPPTEALVVTGEMTVHFESPQSIRAEIRCVLATQADKSASLNLPLKNVTLTGCAIDGRAVLPNRDSANRTQIIIPSEAILSPNQLQNAPNKSGSTGPLALDGWILRNVSYTVRTVPRGSKGSFRIVIPYPASPEMKVQLIDPTQQILTAGVADQPRVSPQTDHRWDFPSIYSRKSAQLGFQLRETSEKEATVQNSVVNCNIEVSSDTIKLATTYIVKPATEDSDRVRIATDPRYRINSIASVAGDTLQWATDAGDVVVQLSPNPQGIQHFVIRQSCEVPLNLEQSVQLDRIRKINGQTADTLRLSVNTTDRFAIESVILEPTQKKRNPADTNAGTNQVPVNMQTDIDIPSDINSAMVRLVQRKSNWEAYLQQSAVVQEETILWNCKCKLDVSGRPVYRQRIRIPDSVKISNVTVSSNGVSRLQSWTRTSDSVVVALREPTRGVVDIKVEGRILRSGDSDTMLPSISLPDAQTLESGLELSAEPNTDAYIRSLGSAVPHIAIDIAKEIIPTKPIRFSILDEPEQVVIKAMPDQKLSAEVAVLIYDSGGQPLLAQFIALRTVEATFDIRFRLQNDGYPDVNPGATRDGKELKLISEVNEFVIPRADRSERLLPTILVIPDLVPPEGQRILPVSLPNFEAKVEIKSHSLFDLRSEVAARTSDAIPEWLRIAIVESDITEETAALKLSDYQFDTTANRFQIAPFQQVRTESINPKRVVSAVGLHVLRAIGETSIVGQSSLLTFSSDVNSTIRISLPPDVVATEVRVNGQPQTIAASSTVPEVTGTEKINYVSITWTTNDSLTAKDSGFEFPGIVDVTPDASVIVVPPVPMPVFWSVVSPVLSEKAFGQKIAASLKRAVRSVNPGFRPKENTVANDVFGLDPTFWEQVQAESPTAATTFRRTVEELHRLAAGEVVLAEPTNDRLLIRSQKMPNALAGFAMLAGLTVIVGSFAKRRRRMPPKTEESDLAPETESAIGTEATATTELSL